LRILRGMIMCGNQRRNLVPGSAVVRNPLPSYLRSRPFSRRVTRPPTTRPSGWSSDGESAAICRCPAVATPFPFRRSRKCVAPNSAATIRRPGLTRRCSPAGTPRRRPTSCATAPDARARFTLARHRATRARAVMSHAGECGFRSERIGYL
jgi:hypothetical protein